MVTIAELVTVRFLDASKWKRNKILGEHTEATINKGHGGWEIMVTTNFGRKKFLDGDGSPTMDEARSTAEGLMKEWDLNIESQGRDEYR